MYQALYRKYRPNNFNSVMGQDAVTETLKNSVKNGKISHAYLFTGTRGTGKTTCAKILATAVNCQNSKDGNPCMECESCKAVLSGATDIVEMDAASNNGVNDMRVLKEQISFLPTLLKYRVYIIDEVHMLSDSAFNALLKTLEEPPAHVIFILATTEVHKLPATILSRCQRYDFRRIEASVIKENLLNIASLENFELQDKAAGLIASLADGGMRDALSILDQCFGCSDVVTEKVVTDICGIADFDAQNRFVNAVLNAKSDEALMVINDVYTASVDLKRFCDDLLMYFRNMLVIKTVKEHKDLIVTTTEQYKVIKNMADGFKTYQIMNAINTLSLAKESMKSSSKRAEMELTAIRLCSHLSGVTLEELEERVKNLEDGNIITTPTKKEVAKEEKAVVLEEKPKTNEVSLTDGPCTKWPEILEEIKAHNMLLFGGLYGSKAYIKNGRLLIDSKLEQFRTMINNDPTLKDVIKAAIKKILGVSLNIGPYKREEKEEDPLLAFANSLK